MKVISYNLRKNRAIGDVVALSQRHEPDIVCLQECDTVNLPPEIGQLHLVESTKSNRLGLAIYFRKDRFTAQDTKTFALKKSMHDRLLSPAHERLIGTRLMDIVSNRELVVASFHAAPLTASNALRRAQIQTAHEELHTLGPGLPTLMVGDFNYPLFKKQLSARVSASGYDMTFSDSLTYTRYKVFRGYFDLATSMGLNIGSVETLPQVSSDHMPILVTCDYKTSAHAESADSPQPVH
ncbi:MAG: Exonuclease [Glaciihabitans sp.]|nr:Exonuclease [Glaciihabitans sp.]